MTTSEEIVVCGDNFIERRIFISPQTGEVENLQHSAYTRGYNRGWARGFVMGLGLFGLAALCIWAVVQW